MTKYEHVGKKILWAQDTELTIYTLGFSKFMCKYLNLKTEICKKAVSYLTQRSQRIITMLFRMVGSGEVSSSLARAATHFLAKSAFCKHNFPGRRNQTYMYYNFAMTATDTEFDKEKEFYWFNLPKAIKAKALILLDILEPLNCESWVNWVNWVCWEDPDVWAYKQSSQWVSLTIVFVHTFCPE